MADPVTPERLARLRQLHEAATDGRWRREDHHHDGLEAWEVVTDDLVVACVPDDHDAQDDTQSRIDAELVAETRNALPDLLNEIERLRTLHDRWCGFQDRLVPVLRSLGVEDKVMDRLGGGRPGCQHQEAAADA